MGDVLDQIREAGRRAAETAPRPSVEQMRRVGQLVRRDDTRKVAA